MSLIVENQNKLNPKGGRSPNPKGGRSPNLNEKRPWGGRPSGSVNHTIYRWKVTIFNTETKTFQEGKYFSIPDINKKLNLNLNSDYVRRIMTHYRADPNMRYGKNSFLARYGHIKIEKIKECVQKECVQPNGGRSPKECANL